METFVKEINKKRKTGDWYQYTGRVAGRDIRIKGYKTWLQIYTIDGIDYANSMDRKVKEFNMDLAAPFKS